MATNNVKINYIEITKKISEINESIEYLEHFIATVSSLIVGQTNAWDAKYQKAFDKHFQTQTIGYIKTVLRNCKTYNNYLEKTLNGYKRIDRF